MRDILKNFPTEIVEIYDKNGNRITKVNGLFGKTSLTIADTTVPIIEDQIVIRTLPNKMIEKYEIIESKYVRGHGGIPDFYKLILMKETVKNKDSSNIIYNDNSIHIGDNNKIDKSIIGDSNK